MMQMFWLPKYCTLIIADDVNGRLKFHNNELCYITDFQSKLLQVKVKKNNTNSETFTELLSFSQE